MSGATRVGVVGGIITTCAGTFSAGHFWHVLYGRKIMAAVRLVTPRRLTDDEQKFYTQRYVVRSKLENELSSALDTMINRESYYLVLGPRGSGKSCVWLGSNCGNCMGV